MKQRLDACVVLGCHGSTTLDGFCFCHGIQNSVMDLTQLDDESYFKILEFLEQACGLFEAPINDYNKCVNVLSLLYRTFQAFDQQMLFNVQSFLKNHRTCGIWVMLVMKEDVGRNYE